MLHISNLFIKSLFIAAGNCLSVGISVVLPVDSWTSVILRGRLSSTKLSWADFIALGTSSDSGLESLSRLENDAKNSFKLFHLKFWFLFLGSSFGNSPMRNETRPKANPRKTQPNLEEKNWEIAFLTCFRPERTTKLPSIEDLCCQSTESLLDRCTFWATRNPKQIQWLRNDSR